MFLDLIKDVLSDVLNEQAVRAFTKKGFSQAKRNSPFYGQKTITSGIRGRQEIRAINLVFLERESSAILNNIIIKINGRAYSILKKAPVSGFALEIA